MTEKQEKRQSATLIDLLDSWGIDLRKGSLEPVRVLRHAGDDGAAHRFYGLGIEEFEWYQGSQKKKIFGDAAILISFIGTGASEADFVGVYRVQESMERFIDPPFVQTTPSDLIEKYDVRYHYQLTRLTEFDKFRERIRIAWGPQANRWVQSFPWANKQIIGLKSNAGDWLVPKDRKSLWSIENISPAKYLLQGDGLYYEGDRSLRIHFAIERNAALVRDAKARYKETHNGRLNCQACAFDFSHVYGHEYIECHHTIPVHSLSSTGSTHIDDVVLLCANCHRMVHRRKEWLTLEELQTLLGRLNPLTNQC